MLCLRVSLLTPQSFRHSFLMSACLGSDRVLQKPAHHHSPPSTTVQSEKRYSRVEDISVDLSQRLDLDCAKAAVTANSLCQFGADKRGLLRALCASTSRLSWPYNGRNLCLPWWCSEGPHLWRQCPSSSVGSASGWLWTNTPGQRLNQASDRGTPHTCGGWEFYQYKHSILCL